MLFSSITKGALLPSKTISLEEIQLVRCLTYISQSYFAPERPLVLSSPSNYRDVQRELIAEIHRTAIWPVILIVDGNTSNTDETDFIDRDGNYIILIPDGNIEYFHAKSLGLKQDRKNNFTKIWDSEARFVVAAANELSTLQKRDIFDYLSIFRIYNCIIVSQEPYVINKRNSSPINSNDVDTVMRLVVYTWFPYQSSDRCTEANDINLLDSWVISAQGHFTKNNDLFPRKISDNLKGCPMKVVVRDADWDFTSYYDYRLDSNGSNVTEVFGVEMELLKLVLKQMNMTFIHVPTPDGFEFLKGMTDNLTKVMLAKEVYIALGELGTHYLIDKFLDVTTSYYSMSFRWYVPCSVKYYRRSGIFKILSVELWLFLIISIVIVAISITLVARYSCTSEWQVYKTMTSSLTNVWAVILGVSVSTMPRAPSLRSLFLAWVSFSLAFNTVFQAFLIDSSYQTTIQNEKELYESGIKFYYPPDIEFLFENSDEMEVSLVQRNLASCHSFWVCFDWAINHQNTSVFASDFDIEFYYYDVDTLGENSENLLCSLEEGLVYNNALRMAMLKGDPLMRRVTEIIDRVVEGGLYNYWISLEMDWIILVNRQISLVNRLDGYRSFNLYHMEPAFYLLLMGWCLSALCFIFELLYNRILSKRK